MRSPSTVRSPRSARPLLTMAIARSIRPIASAAPDPQVFVDVAVCVVVGPPTSSAVPNPVVGPPVV